MRLSAFALALLLLPTLSEAQRRPRTPLGGQPPRATPSGPQPRVVHEAMMYRRLRVSFEGYMFVNHISAPGFTGLGDFTWTSGGAGTRAEYRFHRLAAATLDMTATLLGGPVFNESAELGMRFGPSRAAHNIVPFVDVRAGYFYSHPRQQFGDFAFNPAVQSPIQSDYSHGFGGVAGAGVEFALTRQLSLMTAAGVARSRMSGRSFNDPSFRPAEYTMTAMRYTAALRFNPVRLLTQ